MNNTDGAGGFAGICRAFGNGDTTLDELRAALDRLTVFAVRPQQPGLLVTQIPGSGPWLPVFTSLAALHQFVRRNHAGEASHGWLSTTGADLIQQLPPGVGLLIDPQHDHAVALPPPWLHTS
jgi:hypothetical protein